MSEVFYPEKKRRTAYSRTKKGKYYSNYSYYRQEIREDSLFRCVYCDIHEFENGGEDHMNLDHFFCHKLKLGMQNSLFLKEYDIRKEGNMKKLMNQQILFNLMSQVLKYGLTVT